MKIICVFSQHVSQASMYANIKMLLDLFLEVHNMLLMIMRQSLWQTRAVCVTSTRQTRVSFRSEDAFLLNISYCNFLQVQLISTKYKYEKIHSLFAHRGSPG